MTVRDMLTMFIPGYYFTRYKKNEANEALGGEFKKRANLKTAFAYVIGLISFVTPLLTIHTLIGVDALSFLGPLDVFIEFAGAAVVGLIGLEMGYRVGKALARHLSLNHSTKEATDLYLEEVNSEMKDGNEAKTAKNLSSEDKIKIKAYLPLNPTHPEKYKAEHKDEQEQKTAQEALVKLHTAKTAVKASPKNFFGVLPKEKQWEKRTLNYAISRLRTERVDSFLTSLNKQQFQTSHDFLKDVISPKL